MRILLVDDLEDVRTSYREMLATGGHDVREAAGGEEALDMIRRERFDLVVTDLSMPSVSGLELARRAKEVDPELAVVLVTGWPGDRPASEFRAAGIDQVLGKPCLRDDLLAAVGAAVTRSRSKS